MNLNKMKNILILMLVAAAVFQTGTLWLEGTTSHNFFYTLFYSIGKGGQSDAANAAIINPKRVVVGYGNKKYSVIYPGLENSSMIEKTNNAIRDMMENGTFVSKEKVDWEEMLAGKAIVCEFPFTVAASEYKKGFQIKGSLFTANPVEFDSIVILPGRNLSETTKIYFINEKPKEAACFVLERSSASVDLYNEIDSFYQKESTGLAYISTKQNSLHLFAEDTFVPQWTQSSVDYQPLIKINPFASTDGEVRGSLLEEYMDGFFSNYASRVPNKDDAGVYMFSDEETVVKYYPTGVLEYYNYAAYDSKIEQTVATAYHVCNQFLRQDRSLATNIALSDVQLTEEGLIFYYDYTVDNLPIVLSEKEKEKTGVTHAIEIIVRNNTVRKYKKYAFNFEKASAQIKTMSLDFITALNTVMANYTGEEVITQIDSIELGYFVEDGEMIGRKWFLVMNGILYICDSV